METLILIVMSNLVVYSIYSQSFIYAQIMIQIYTANAGSYSTSV